MTTSVQVLNFACPTCGARPGEDCRGDGYRIHLARWLRSADQLDDGDYEDLREVEDWR